MMCKFSDVTKNYVDTLLINSKLLRYLETDIGSFIIPDSAIQLNMYRLKYYVYSCRLYYLN